jgi:hypothetical protein
MSKLPPKVRDVIVELETGLIFFKTIHEDAIPVAA